MTSAHWTFGQVPPGPHSSDEALREGAAFGPYRLQNALGEGATSWVFAASDPVGRRVAIKVLKTGFN
ncbi:MAG: hypothetical protein JKY65_19060 [Planctomycetes bacterium]|nr:hypothetical protein [Planctomycetota bacterium]